MGEKNASLYATDEEAMQNKGNVESIGKTTDDEEEEDDEEDEEKIKKWIRRIKDEQ